MNRHAWTEGLGRIPGGRRLALLGLAAMAAGPVAGERADYDLIVYGATPAGIAAAVTASRGGEAVLVLESSYLIGGMMSGGLTKTDIGRGETIGGYAREFYDRVLAHYTEAYGADSAQVAETDGGYFFEPKVALRIFEETLEEAGVEVRIRAQLVSAQVVDGRLRALTVRDYRSGEEGRFSARQFIDATYEGDLLAAAEVLYRVGREARSEYGEPLAGLSSGPAQYLGMGDHRPQAYNIRGTISRAEGNTVPFPRPQTYYRAAHEGLIRTIREHGISRLSDLFPDYGRWGWVNDKCDPNKADAVGLNFAYPEADYAARKRIVAAVQDYWLSLWYMLQSDPEVPEAFRADMRRYGLPKDEYAESGHVTPQVYVRVARRMMGQYFLTQVDLEVDRFKPDGIAMGSYNLDSHEIQHIWTDAGRVSEGFFIQSVDPYEIPYRSILPHGVDNLLVVCAVSASHVAYSSLRMEPVFMMIGHAAGLASVQARRAGIAVQDVDIDAVRTELRATGVGLDAPFRPVVTIRMVTPGPHKPGQPIEMELVERHTRGALERIHWNFDGSGRVQATGRRVTYQSPVPRAVQAMLIVEDADGLMSMPATADLRIGEPAGHDREVHYLEARLTGRWDRTRGSDIEYRRRVGLVDNRSGDGSHQARFETVLEKAGRYLVALGFPSAGNRATQVPVTVGHRKGEALVKVNQRRKAGPFAFIPLGEFRYKAGETAWVNVSNEGANGFVVIDSVRWIWLED